MSLPLDAVMGAFDRDGDPDSAVDYAKGDSVDSIDAAVGAAGKARSKAAEAYPPPAVSKAEELRI